MNTGDNMARTALLLLLLLATFSGTLSSCSRAFIVKAEGKYGDTIYFRFYKLEGTARATHNVVELIVQEKIGDNQWDPVWSLSGERSIDEIGYGKKYDGLNEITPALPLSLKGEYRVQVKDGPRFDPPGYGYVQFTFDDAGEIVMLSDWDSTGMEKRMSASEQIQ